MPEDSQFGEVAASPPGADEIEVSLFGPGVGECIVVHLGDGKWLVVDSCITPGDRSGTPIALRYLEGMGIDVSTSVVMIVASHWHDDHVRGIASVMDRAKSAKFYASGALRHEEFAALTKLPPLNSKFSSGVEEMVRVREVVDARSGNSGLHYGLVGASQRIYCTPNGAVREVWALSPSDGDKIIGLQRLSALMPRGDGGLSKIPALSENDLSVVLHLETVGGSVLLGGDLEYRAEEGRGWRAIIGDLSRPDFCASLYKVAHHGSSNADHEDIWTRLLGGDVISIISPYHRGVSPIPKSTDLDRIAARSSATYLSCRKQKAGLVHRDRDVAKMIKAATRSFVPDGREMGHVQVRSAGDSWKVRCNQVAVRVDAS
ncbi:MBL fold metallo-hydrolase [Streptomyces xanthophaeus]|uniref:MBL fold metallo-hydrolase n=1 Tax=Streptomyces xanthophaeus TaxID=67385 RepID=UPI003655FC4E